MAPVNPSDPATIPKFADPLPVPPVLEPDGMYGGRALYSITMRQAQQRLLRRFRVVRG